MSTPADKPPTHHPAGWPRPRGDYEPEEWVRDRHPDREEATLPIPWIVALKEDGKPDWTTFHDQARQAHDRRLCQICGEELGQVVVLGRYGTEEQCSGPGCHPRCFAVAAKFCPHFAKADDAVIAYRYEGVGLGYVWEVEDEFWREEGPYLDSNDLDPACVPLTRAEVRQLAKDDPLGEGIASLRPVAAGAR